MKRIALIVLGAAALLAGCAGQGAATPGPGASGPGAGLRSAAAGAVRSAPGSPAGRAAANVAAASRKSPDGNKPLPVAPGAGRLPQTQQYPSTHDAAWRHMIADMWLAVTTGNAGDALPAFFPEAAYAQVKAISSPQADWTGRLWVDFTLDVRAAHDLVGPHATLLKVLMAPRWEAAWIPPGYCYNSVGYWHINGARLVYLTNGQERSIGIASLISWRGVWYVVHFGGVVRPAVGMVDDPGTGPGVPGPAGGC